MTKRQENCIFFWQVDVGNLVFNLGKLEYFKEVQSKIIPIEVWIGVGCAVALIVIIGIIIYCWCRRSHRKQKKNFKSLEVQMNNLESKVARECREGEYSKHLHVRSIFQPLYLSVSHLYNLYLFIST